MPDIFKERFVCSGCRRPWHSILLKTCRDCRRRAQARRHAPTVPNTDLSTNLSPSGAKRRKESSKLLPLPIPLPALLPRPQTDYCRQSQEAPRSRDNRKRSLPQLMTTPLRAHKLFIVEESRDQQQAARNKMRLYPKPTNQESLAGQQDYGIRQEAPSIDLLLKLKLRGTGTGGRGLYGSSPASFKVAWSDQ